MKKNKKITSLEGLRPSDEIHLTVTDTNIELFFV